jgi:hypothetical protein
LRSLRRILRLASTCIDRSNTNRAVVQKASSIAYPDTHGHRSVKLFSEHYNERRASLLGHIIRACDSDPLRQISLSHRRQYGKKRCGRPRQNWLHFAKKYVYENKLHLQNYEEGSIDGSLILNAATNKQS